MISIHELGKSFTEMIPKRFSGQTDIFEKLLISLLCNGNVLLEENSDYNISDITYSFSSLTGLQVGIIDSNSDLMPADIKGVSVYQQDSDEFRIYPGPFAQNIVLINNINLASPFTQSSLIGIADDPESQKIKKIEPQMIIATDSTNFDTRFKMPVALKERFFFYIKIKPLSTIDKIKYLKADETDVNLEGVLNKETIKNLTDTLNGKMLNEKLVDLILMISTETRNDNRLLVGASPVRSRALNKATIVKSLLQNREPIYMDVIDLSVDVIMPSIILSTDSILNKSIPEDIIKSIVDSTLIKWKEKYGVL